MQITLAMPYDGHRPDDTVDFPDAVARELLRTGWGRTPDEPAKPRKAAAKKADDADEAPAD